MGNTAKNKLNDTTGNNVTNQYLDILLDKMSGLLKTAISEEKYVSKES